MPSSYLCAGEAPSQLYYGSSLSLVDLALPLSLLLLLLLLLTSLAMGVKRLLRRGESEVLTPVTFVEELSKQRTLSESIDTAPIKL